MAWYPLNGDYKNYGLLGNEIKTTETFTPQYTTNGKIGKGLTRGGLKWDAESTNKILNHKQLSICFWWKNLEGTEDKNMFFGNDTYRTFSLFRYPNKNDFHWSWANKNNKTIGSGRIIDLLPDNQWIHICIVYNTPKAILYVNGEYKQVLTTQYAYENNAFNKETQFLYDSQTRVTNDWRFYDHALSESEIKEISKAKILHYNFESIYGNPNLIVEANKASSWTQENDTRLQNSDERFKEHIKVITYGNNQRIYRSVSNVWLTQGEVFTVSFYAKSDTSGKTMDASRSIGDFTNSFTLTTEWKKYVGQITVTGISDKGTLSLRFHTAGTYYIADVKLEKGKSMTPWCPNVADVSYDSELATTVYDISGYERNGTINGDIQYNKESSIGEYSLKFKNDGYCRINVIDNFYPAGSMLNELTLSCWFKMSEEESATTESLRNLITFDANYFVRYRLLKDMKSVQVLYQVGNEETHGLQTSTFYWTGEKLCDSKWHNIVWVFKNGKSKVYIDNIFTNERDVSDNGTTIIRVSPSIHCYIGSYTDSKEMMVGNIDDVRVYATALTDEDIKQLYNERVKVDNVGNMYCSELNEEERRVEYLESSGTQYIDTEIKSSGETAFEITFEDNGISTNDRDNNNSRFYVGYGWNNSNIGFAYGSTINQLKMVGINEKATIKFDTNKELYINGEKTNISMTAFGSNVLNLYLFIRNTNVQIKNTTYTKIYSCKIWQNNTLVRDFVPMISTEDGHVGEASLFDTVTNKYFYNKGTGKFITNLDESTTNINFTNKGVVYTDYLIEGKDTTKIRKDGNIIEVNNIYEN